MMTISYDQALLFYGGDIGFDDDDEKNQSYKSLAPSRALYVLMHQYKQTNIWMFKE